MFRHVDKLSLYVSIVIMTRGLASPENFDSQHNTFLNDLLSDLQAAPISKPVDIPNPKPDEAPLYIAKRQWLPLEGDVFDSVPIQALLTRYGQFAKPPIRRALTVLPRWQLRVLAEERGSKRPTKEAVESAASSVPVRLPVSTNRVEPLKGYNGRWFVAFILEPDSNKLAQDDNKTILKRLEAHDYAMSKRYGYLGHLSVFATDTRTLAEKLSQDLQSETVFPGRLLFGGVETARAFS